MRFFESAGTLATSSRVLARFAGAFATVGAIEGAVAVATGQLTALSEQQIVSCEVLSGDGNNGCSGGDAGFSMYWITNKEHGLCTEAEWP